MLTFPLVGLWSHTIGPVGPFCPFSGVVDYYVNEVDFKINCYRDGLREWIFLMDDDG